MLNTGILMASVLVSAGIDDEARLPYWQISDGALTIRLVQRLPDQTRGFFMARGFREKEVEPIAQSCVFQTVVKNMSTQAAPVTMDYNLREWIIDTGGNKRRMKTREDWKPVWRKLGIAEPAQLAFEWALLPTRQQYRAGDYGWGMSMFNLKPGTTFDLDLAWRLNGERRQVRIKGIRCAPDVHPDPPAE